MSSVTDQILVSVFLLLPLEMFLTLSFAIGAILTAPIHWQFRRSIPNSQYLAVDTSALVISQGIVSCVVVLTWSTDVFPVMLVFMIVSLWLYLFVAFWYCKLCLNSTGIGSVGYRFCFLTAVLLNSFLVIPYLSISAIYFREWDGRVLFFTFETVTPLLLIISCLSLFSLISSLLGLRYRSSVDAFRRP